MSEKGERRYGGYTQKEIMAHRAKTRAQWLASLQRGSKRRHR